MQGMKKPRFDCLGQVNFDLGQAKKRCVAAQWASEISLSGPVSLFESASLVDDFQTEMVSKLKTTR